jgi:HK97 family phage portal protein
MANPLARAWDYLRGNDLSAAVAARPAGETKFSPSDPSQNWQYVNHLVYTANTQPYEGSGTGDANSAVFACLLAYAKAAIEPPLRTYRVQADRSRDEMPAANPLQELLDDPNPSLDMLEIRWWLAYARHCDGNAYLVKARSGNERTGEVVELWPVSPSRIGPWTERDSPNFIDYYRYQRADGDYEKIPVENVIHFKLGVDDRDHRKGLSPLKRLVREVASDAEATRFADTLLTNFGVPGLVLSLPDTAQPPPEQIELMKQRTKNAFWGQNRGNVAVVTGGATMQQFGFSPEQLNLKVLHDFPETRIAAVMGVPASLAGLGVGLEQTSNFASARQMKENFTENTLVPLWTMDEAKWNKGLKREFTDDKSIVIAHDLTEVRALQEDMDAKYKRLTEAVKAKWLLPDEARAEVGFPPLPNGAGAEFAPEPTPAPPGQPAADDTANEASRGIAEAKGPQWNDWMQMLVDEGSVLFEEDLRKLQNEQKRKLQRALINGTAR